MYIKDYIIDVHSFSLQCAKPTQEDAFFCSADNRLFIVCDGVGGRSGGAEASRIIVETFESLYSDGDLIDCTWVENTIDVCRGKYLEFISSYPACRSMASTFLLCFMHEENLFVAHLGDTKMIYFSKKSKTVLSTRDHNIGNASDIKKVSLSRNEDYKRSNTITRAIKYTDVKDESDMLECNSVPGIGKEDCILMLTDGCLEHMTPSDLGSMIVNHGHDFTINYLKKLCEKKSYDNSTCISIYLK